MANWIRVDDNPDEPIRINLVVDRKKYPNIALWYTNIKYGKASDEIRKALEFYIAHGQNAALPSDSDSAPVIPACLLIKPDMPSSPAVDAITSGATGIPG